MNERAARRQILVSASALHGGGVVGDVAAVPAPFVAADGTINPPAKFCKFPESAIPIATPADANKAAKEVV